MPQLEQFTAPVDAGPCPAGPSLDGVLARMRALDAALPPRDGVAVFNRVYLAVTEEVGRRVDRGRFPDPHAAITLDVRFAERYLDAVDPASGVRPPAGARCCSSAATPAYARCSSPSRESTRTSGTTSHSPSWTPVVASAANRPSWRTSSTAWAISSSRWRSDSAKS